MNSIYDLERYLRYKIEYLKNKLSQMTKVYRVELKRDSSVIYRVYREGKLCVRKSTTPEGKVLEQHYNEQLILKNRIRDIETSLQLLTSSIESNSRLLLNKKDLTSCRNRFGEWENLKEVPNTFENKKHYIHNGKDYDSKAEVSLAEVYEMLNIPFKHSVELYIDGRRVLIDFVPLIEETGDYYLHEHIGMDDRYLYQKNTLRKYEAFHMENMFIGKDVLFTYENQDNFADKSYYINCITMILNNILSKN